MTFGASRTAIFGYVTERCDLTITGGGASGGTLAHSEIDKGPQRPTFLPDRERSGTDERVPAYS